MSLIIQSLPSLFVLTFRQFPNIEDTSCLTISSENRELSSATNERLLKQPAQDFRFTRHGNRLYAIELAWPADGKAVIHALKAEDGVKSVTLLANGKSVPFKQADDGLHLTLPAKPVGEYVYVLRIELGSK